MCSRKVGSNDYTLWCRWSHDHTLWCRWSHDHILWCRWSHDHTLWCRWSHDRTLWCRCKHVQPLHRLSTSLLTFANVKCSLPAANKGTLDYSSWIYTGTTLTPTPGRRCTLMFMQSLLIWRTHICMYMYTVNVHTSYLASRNNRIMPRMGEWWPKT